MHRTVGEALGSRNNALNFIRLGLAAAVIWQHMFGTTDLYMSETLAGLPGEWGVNGFFAISGFLIAGSRMRMGFLPYLWRRMLRILPAFWVCLVVTAFFIAPLSASVLGNAYSIGDGVMYVLRNLGLVMQQRNIGETLEGAHSSDWNVSLWTLAYEFLCYIFIGVLYSVPFIRKHHVAASAILLAVLMIGLWMAYQDYAANEWTWLALFRLTSFFAAGALVSSLQNRLRISWKGLAVALVSIGVLAFVDLVGIFAQLPFTYLLLWLGASLPFRLGSVNDISYGIYIYGYPIEQLLALLGGEYLGIAGFLLVALAATALPALLSWHFVEKQAMKLTRLVPVNRPSPVEALKE